MFVVLINKQAQQYNGKYLVFCFHDPTIFTTFLEAMTALQKTIDYGVENDYWAWSIFEKNAELEIRELDTTSHGVWTTRNGKLKIADTNEPQPQNSNNPTGFV